ncbi:radical SAM protein [Heliobacterium mobile]|uniref:radical SAM protein n=1 Tax=Heliobacterium mobile TaxID=28064 RepID=UPI0014787D44|nr:radical SAM protein [Heliobacterium mobile]
MQKQAKGAEETKAEEIKSREWNQEKRWNPFNSYKLLSQVYRWEGIKRGRDIPQPALITIDPSNVCNLNCAWCNAEVVRKERGGMLSEKALLAIADFLPRWGEKNPFISPGVEAVCIAGGGEPLLNPATPAFIDRLAQHKIHIGLVSNGTRVNHCIDALSQCDWVGASIDAGSAATFNKLKGLPDNTPLFDTIITNLSNLIDYSKRHNSTLGSRNPAYGVSYKYLLYKENIGEIYQAAKLAKEIGCKNIHIRPAGTTWDKIGTDEEIRFNKEDIQTFNEQIEQALSLDDNSFNVYGVTHKFDSQFNPSNCFERCHAIFMTAAIMPPIGKDAPKDAFTLGLCCDRRGDQKLELARNLEDVEQINKLWGNDAHWKIFDSIDVEKECPRCTYQPHNQIYENVILKDSMTHRFI